MLNHAQIHLILFLTMLLPPVYSSANNLNEYAPDNEYIFSSGRIDRDAPGKLRLISSGSYLAFQFRGSELRLDMKNNFEDDNEHYVAVELDGRYLEKQKIEYGKSNFQIVSGLEEGIHKVVLCKATEALSGYLEIGTIYCEELIPNDFIPSRRIEFIGNSITCGAQSDTTDAGCDEGVYNDHMNAYLAYGTRVSRDLKSDYVLSSVSGLGLTRTWNAEHPTIPEVYESLYLTDDKTKLWKSNDYSPDLVSICLGTNDFSEGDGSYNREPLDSARFISTYRHFLNLIHQRYPVAKICLLNSPVFDGEQRITLDSWLQLIEQSLNKEWNKEIVSHYTFKDVYNSGCTGHPDISDHEKIAKELVPVYKEIMNW